MAEQRTVLAGGCLAEDEVLVGVVSAVVVAVTELATSDADVRGRALVAAGRTRRHRAVQLVTQLTVSAVISLVTHLTTDQRTSALNFHSLTHFN